MEPYRLVDGVYPREEALELLEALKEVKVAFLEKKISRSDEVEDIKARERRILELKAEFEQLVQETGNEDKLVLKVLVWS